MPTFKRTLNTRISHGFASFQLRLGCLFLSPFFRGDSWRITLTLVRKFRVEFIAALYLASNMHETAFKPLQNKKAKNKETKKSVCSRGNKFCICTKRPRHCSKSVLNLKIVSRPRPKSPALPAFALGPIIVKIQKLCDARKVAQPMKIALKLIWHSSEAPKYPYLIRGYSLCSP